jgi:hypothetical protein
MDGHIFSMGKINSILFQVKKIKDLPPLSLFKYYDLSDKAINAVEQKYLYAPHPDQLNDPYDCYENIIEMTDPHVALNIDKYWGLNSSLEEISEKLRSNDEYLIRCLQYQLKMMTFQKTGVLSLTSDPENLLMWSYYSNHKGFCVEFDYVSFPFSFFGPFQINYQSEIETVSARPLELAFLYQTNIKHVSWKHEMEWRLLAHKTHMEIPGIDFLKSEPGEKREFQYLTENIKSITLGNRFFHNNNEIRLLDINTAEHEITLKEQIEKKKAVLDIVINQNIPTFIISRDYKTFKIIRKSISIREIDSMKYKLIET